MDMLTSRSGHLRMSELNDMGNEILQNMAHSEETENTGKTLICGEQSEND